MKRWQSTGNWVKSVSYSSISYASVECKCLVFLLYRDCTAHTVYTFSLNEAKRIESINCSLVNLINNYIGFPFHLIPVFVCCVYILCIFLLHEWTRTNLTFSIVYQWLRYSLCSSFAPIINFRKRSSLPWNAHWIKTLKIVLRQDKSGILPVCTRLIHNVDRVNIDFLTATRWELKDEYCTCSTLNDQKLPLPWSAQWIKTWKSYCPTRQEWNTRFIHSSVVCAQWIKTWKSYCPTRQEWNTRFIHSSVVSTTVGVNFGFLIWYSNASGSEHCISSSDGNQQNDLNTTQATFEQKHIVNCVVIMSGVEVIFDPQCSLSRSCVGSGTLSTDRRW